MSDDLLRAKMALETEIGTLLLRIFTAYCDERSRVRYFGTYETSRWLRKVEDALAHHYAVVAFVATGRHVPDRPTIHAAALSVDHAERMIRRVREKPPRLIASIEKLFSEVDLVESKDSFYSRLTAKARTVLDRIKKWLPGVAAHETNEAVEDALAEHAKQRAGSRPLFKKWSTVRDNRVRDWHMDAEGQVMPANQPFQVGGEKLMFPGDTRLGASLKNVINCRCSARYFARNEDGSEEELAATIRGIPKRYARQPGKVDHPSLITREVRLREGMRERVFLSDGLEAIVSIRSGVLRITRPAGTHWERLAIGRYTHGMMRGQRVQNLIVDVDGLGIRELIERSVRAATRQ